MRIALSILIFAGLYLIVGTVASLFIPQWFGVVGVLAGIVGVALYNRKVNDEKERKYR